MRYGCCTIAEIFTSNRSTVTKLEKPLKREIMIGKDAYVVTLSPTGVKLVPKGKRKGIELAWEALISGDAELAVALRAATANAPK